MARSAQLKLPLRDGDIDRPDDENAEAHALNARKEALQIVSRSAISDLWNAAPEITAMCCEFLRFNANGNRGVAAGLGNIQKVKDGERLAGKATAASDFD